MHRTLRSRLLLAGVLALTGLSLTPSPASAAPVDKAELAPYWGGYSGTTGCTATPNPLPGRLQLTANQSATEETGGTTTIKNASGVTTQVVTYAKGTTSYRTRSGRLDTVDLVGSGRAELQIAPGQTCAASGWVGLETEVTFTLTEPSWASASLTGTRGSSTWIEVERNGAPYDSFGLDSETLGGSSTGTWYLPAGTYELSLGLDWNHYNSAGQPPLNAHIVSGSGKAHLQLHPAGSAYAPASGTGTPYVGITGQSVCGQQTKVPVTFTDKAAKIKAGAYLVNGTKVATFRNVKAWQKSAVAPLGGYRSNTVQVRMVVDPPGPKTSLVVVATRKFRACQNS